MPPLRNHPGTVLSRTVSRSVVQSWRGSVRVPASALAVAVLVACAAPEERAGEPGPEIFRASETVDAAELEAVRSYLRTRVQNAISRHGIPSITMGLYDDEGVLWAEGFGQARTDGTAATPETVYRVGSVSKLFTDVAVMQLVEQGRLDLDAPITDVLPAFTPENPFGTAITLRQLMCHRAGLVREPPIGNYFDATEPSLEATVDSLAETTLVHEPGTATKYSNGGIAVVGRVLEVVTGLPFAQAVREAVLDPLGMSSSDFEPSERVLGRLAEAEMRTLDRRRFPAPTFELGMAPAGSLYSTALDLAAFSGAIFDGGGALLKPESLEEMLTPQFAEEGATSGFGLGFGLGELVLADGAEGGDAAEGVVRTRRVGHNGAIYGFSTSLVLLPEHDLGVAIASSLDVSNGLIAQIAREALDLLLRAELGDEAPGSVTERIAALQELDTEPVDADLATRLAGTYAGEGRTFTLRKRPAGDAATLVLDLGNAVRELRQRTTEGRTTLVMDDVDGRGAEIEVVEASGALSLRTPRGTYAAAPVTVPAPAAQKMADVLGTYGEEHNPTLLFERGGDLWAQIEWLELTRLRPVEGDPDTFAIDTGMYHGETLRFERDASGAVQRLYLGPMPFDRREELAAGGTFRIEPVRPVSELRKEALAASPPGEEPAGDEPFRASELVELTALDPSIRLDVRYAGTNNFMSATFYDEPRAFLQRPAAEALVRVHRALREKGYGLLIHDAYRPWYVTKMFWDATPEDKKIFVADPSRGSRHNRGCAVDLTLFDLETGEPIQMVGGYDEMTDRSFPDHPGGTARQRYHRELLREAMEAEGFAVYEFEWWHFDYQDWQRYGLQNATFDQL